MGLLRIATTMTLTIGVHLTVASSAVAFSESAFDRRVSPPDLGHLRQENSVLNQLLESATLSQQSGSYEPPVEGGPGNTQGSGTR